MENSNIGRKNSGDPYSILVDKLTPDLDYSGVANMQDFEYRCSQGDGVIYVKYSPAGSDVDVLRQALAGCSMYFELETLPDPTYGDPIPNIPCEDGSTIMANTPQTDIVNAIDVPSTIGYSTKIA